MARSCALTRMHFICSVASAVACMARSIARSCLLVVTASMHRLKMSSAAAERIAKVMFMTGQVQYLLHQCSMLRSKRPARLYGRSGASRRDCSQGYSAKGLRPESCGSRSSSPGKAALRLAAVVFVRVA